MHRRPIASGVVAVLLAVLLAGCGVLLPAPSPKSTVVGPSGQPLVLDWKDYPAQEGTDGEALLEQPDQAQLEAPARTLLADLRDALEEATGSRVIAVEPEEGWFSDDHWYPTAGNGYGGGSMLTTLNCCEQRTERVPDRTRWHAVVDALSDVTAAARIGRIDAAYDARGRNTDPTVDEQHLDQYCNLPDRGCWLWSAWTSDGHQWVNITIQDGTLDPTGRAAREAQDSDRPVTSISVDYGATVVRAGRRGDYERALAPFRGLEQPPATSSD